MPFEVKAEPFDRVARLNVGPAHGLIGHVARGFRFAGENDRVLFAGRAASQPETVARRIQSVGPGNGVDRANEGNAKREAGDLR